MKKKITKALPGSWPLARLRFFSLSTVSECKMVWNNLYDDFETAEKQSRQNAQKAI
jgi:hypothetical protein